VRAQADPPQTDAVLRAIEEALSDAEPAADPWWQAGIEDALEE
jgi:hypothetical protein